MTAITVTARSRLVLKMLFLVALTMGGSAIASAAPGVWDIESFDSCTELLDDGINESQQQKLDETKYCCVNTGGVWNEGQQACQAPPAEGTGATRPLNPRAPIDEKVPAEQVAPPTTTTVRPLPGLPDIPILPPMG
jgi:hypothetical protein